MDDLQCIIVTPESTVCDERTDFVALPLYDGELGVAPGRTPLVGRLGLGELRIGHKHGARCYYVEGGFVEVAGGVVSVITGRAVPAEELDEAAERELLESARRRAANTPELIAARDRAVTTARARLLVARRAAE